uniref:Uncharacterized protein n=1 Tax=Arundo donax TaxID=35708 RepID=A0A0A9E545_ARUDO
MLTHLQLAGEKGSSVNRSRSFCDSWRSVC